MLLIATFAMALAVKLLEEILVSRPPGAAVPATVTLTHFDVYWLNLPPVQRLFFYAVPHLTTTHFTSFIIHALTSSLSTTLHHFFPLSGRLIIFSCPSQKQNLPCIRCEDGDTVSVAVCETHMDLNHITGDGPRRLEQVKALVPEFPPPNKRDDGTEEKPLLAVQITVIPNSGFSIGLTYSHVAADGKAVVHFIKSWASICRSGCINSDDLPFHNRNLISDKSNELAPINLEINLCSPCRPPLVTIAPEYFRYTFVIGSSKVKELKARFTSKSMHDRHDPPLRASTFMVSCALMWVCLLDAQQESDHEDGLMIGDDEPVWQYFLFLADLRKRLNLPEKYFGNCLRPCFAAAKRSELIGENGVYEAAKAIGKTIEEAEKEGVNGAEGWLKRAMEILGSEAGGGQVITIAGSPKFGAYETDFGCGGRPKKAEHAHIMSFGSIAIGDSATEIGAVEFGLPLTASQFSRFNHAFHLLKP